MQMQMFTVYDAKADYFHNPFLARTKGEAIRMFSDTCQDPNSLFSKHPADFILFHLGSFDQQQCTFDIFATGMVVGKALDFIPAQEDLPLEAKIKEVK